MAVADSGTGTITVQIDGETVATYSSALAFDVNNATSAIRLPNGTTAQRPSGVTGLLRYNSTTDKIEGYTTAGGWAELGASSSSAVSDSGESVIGIGQNAKNLDTFTTTAYDSALYFAVTMDESNNNVVSTQKSTVSVKSDDETIKNKIGGFVSQINKIQSLIGTMTASSTSTDGKVTLGVLAGESLVSMTITSDLRTNAIGDVTGLTGSITRLESIGYSTSGYSNQITLSDGINSYNFDLSQNWVDILLKLLMKLLKEWIL